MNTEARQRIEAVDILRGVVMIIMALDHTRDFFGMPGAQPTNLAVASVALFTTRWVTNICAPVFFLLTGTGAYLSLRKRSVADLSRFLVTRGLWLLVVEVVIARCFAYQFNVDYRVTMLLVLWALGWSMICLAALVRLPIGTILAVGLTLIAGHNLLDGLSITHPLWAVLHAPGFVVNSPAFTVFVAYPLIPWIGVTAVGYVLGVVYEWTDERRQRFLVRLGTGLVAAFIALRWANVYGDPQPWSVQPTAMFTLLSFLNTAKYPPSLLFLLMTLGPAVLLLAAFDRGPKTWLSPARIIGKVPLFYYVLHFALIHAAAVAVCLVKYGTAHWLFESPDLGNYPFTPPPGWGFSLPVVYLAWIAVVVAMYPLCRWFAAVKARRGDWWLSYL